MTWTMQHFVSKWRRTAARKVELRSSEERFRGLFEHVPVSLWEEDFSAVRKYIEELRGLGVVDFSTYFDAHPEAVTQSVARVKIVDVNRATLEMYQADSKEQLLRDLSKVLGSDSLASFKAELLALIRGDLIFEAENINYTLRGERRVVSLRMSVAPGYEQTWAKVFVGISDITRRRQAETALVAERDLLQALMDNIPDTIYFKDTSSRFTRINKAQTLVLGVAKPDDAVGKTDLDFQPLELAKGFCAEEQELVKTGMPLIDRIEYNPTADGEPRWFSTTKVPILDKDGQVTSIVGISRNITEHMLAEEKFRGLLESAPDAVIVADKKGIIQLINSQTEKMFGYDRSEIVGQPIELLVPPQFQDIHQHHRAKFFASPHLGPMGIGPDLHVVRRDGTMFPGEISLSPLESEKGLLVIAAIRDITGRKQAQEALRQSEERFKLMAWATKDAVWDWDLTTNQVWWGEGLQKIFHYSSEITETNVEWWFEHIHPEDIGKVQHTINQALQGGMEFWSKEYRFQRKDGTYADMMDRGYILRDDTGKPYRMIGAMLDITERKYMESQLLETNEQMRQFLDELQRRNREIALLNEMGRLLQACQSAEEAYLIIADLSNQLFLHTAGALYLFNSARTLVNAVATWGELPDANRMFAPDDCCALRRGQTHLLGEIQDNSPCLHLTEPLPAISYCLPIQVKDETLGIFHVQSQQEENLDEIKRQLVYTVVEQAGMALSNLKLREVLHEQSIHDPMTGLYNRRYMEEALKQQVSRVTRLVHLLGIIMIDIDHFKRFNDTYGHAAGDAILHELGQFLQRNIRVEDIACRYGGEEFILIMPDITLGVVQKRAEHLRREAKQLRVQQAGQLSEAITLSLGIAIYPQHGRSIEAVLRAADQALYRAKSEGRDRVVVAEKEP